MRREQESAQRAPSRDLWPPDRPLHVILVEDGRGDALLIERLLRPGPRGEPFDATHVMGVSAAVGRVIETRPACVLLNLGPPDAAVLDAVRELRAAVPDVPVVVLTGTDDAVGVEAVRHGAQDYLVTSRVDDESLRRSIRYAVERMRAERELRRTSGEALLTGLSNRALFMDRLRIALARADRLAARVDRAHRPGPADVTAWRLSATAVMLLDVRGFDELDDRHGRGTGDRVLEVVGARVQELLRTSDSVARLGRDEFAVLCEMAGGPRDALHIGERLVATVAAPIPVDGRNTSVSATVGIAFAHGGGDAEMVLRSARSALQRTRRPESRAVALVDDDTAAGTLRRSATRASVRYALEHDQLRLLYQPVISLRTGRVAGVEALLRLADPRRGLLRPDEFLEAVEGDHLRLAIVGWTLQSALHQVALRRPPSDPRAPLTVAIAAAGEIADPRLVDVVSHALDATARPLGLRVCLDIAETALLPDAPDPSRTMAGLRELGIQLAVTGFGTGPEPWEHVRRFPVDVLKIDRSLIAAMGAAAGEGLVRSATVMAHDLGLSAVAEGVETELQLEALREIGCDMAQGHHVGRPVATSRLARLLRAEHVL